MKVAINKYFIEEKHLTTEQKLQVIEDKIKEAQKELLEELIISVEKDIDIHNKIMNKFKNCSETYISRKYMKMQCEAELYWLNQKLKEFTKENKV